MSKKQTYISFILKNLREGVIEWKENLGLFKGKFGLKEDTFNKYWKLAQEQYKIELRELEKEKASLYKEKELEALRNYLYGKFEKLGAYQSAAIQVIEILESGEVEEVGKKRKITINERRQMLMSLKDLFSEMSRLQGEYPDQKIVHKGDADNPIHLRAAWLGKHGSK